MKRTQKNRKKKRTIKSILGVGGIILFFIVLFVTTLPTTQKIVTNGVDTLKATNINRTQSQNLVLTSRVNTEVANGKGGVELDWSSYDASEKTFKAYQKKEGTEEWQSISTMDFSGDMEPIKILNIYPEVAVRGTFTYLDGTTQELPKSASLKVWMEGGSFTDSEGKVTNFEAYGVNPHTNQKILYVTPVTAAEFNDNPSVIWNYDVVMFGTWDSNGGLEEQPNDAAIAVTEQYIQAGYGVICGHDTIGGIFYDKGLKKLRKYFNIEIGGWSDDYETQTDIDYQDSWGYQSSYVEVTRDGLLTNFPWEIPIGAKLSIPVTHTTANAALGEVWMNLVDGSYCSAITDPTLNYYSYGKGNGYYYLTTYNNTAMIQTGHSNCESTENERKVLANTLFYLKQTTSATSFTDNSSQDYKAPNAPTVTANEVTSDKKIHVTYQAQDNGSVYSFYVEAFSRADASTVLAKSNEVTEEVATGIKGYYYIIDDQPTNEVNIESATYTESTAFDLNITDNGKYIHIRAIDKAGNLGPVQNTHIAIMSKVTVDPDKGILEEKPEVVVKDGMVGETIELGTPKKEGHTFLGWEATKGTINGNKYTFDVEPGEIVAKWKVNDYTYTIRYKEKATEKSIHTTKTSTKPYGTEILPEQEKIEIVGYNYDSATPEGITIGTDSKQNVITIYYIKKGATVTVKYINEQGKTIEENKTISGRVSEPYATVPKAIKGYQLKKSPENAKGTITEEGVEVDYIYELRDAKVIVQYTNEQGNKIAEDTTIIGKFFEPYTAKAKEIQDYQLLQTPENEEGEMTEETNTVTYTYKAVQDSTRAPNKLPLAGTKSKIIVLAIIIIVALMGWSIYKKRKNKR